MIVYMISPKRKRCITLYLSLLPSAQGTDTKPGLLPASSPAIESFVLANSFALEWQVVSCQIFFKTHHGLVASRFHAP